MKYLAFGKYRSSVPSAIRPSGLGRQIRRQHTYAAAARQKIAQALRIEEGPHAAERRLFANAPGLPWHHP